MKGVGQPYKTLGEICRIDSENRKYHIGIISTYMFQMSVPCCKKPRQSNCIYKLLYNSGRQIIIRVYIIYYALRSWTTGLGPKPIRKRFFIHRVRCWTVLVLIVFFFKRLLAYDGRFDLSEYLMNIDHIISIYFNKQIDRVFMGCIIGNARKSP